VFLTVVIALCTAWTHGTATAGPADPVIAASPSFPGANDWSCRTTPLHPRPVVLVHGTFQSPASTWQDLAPTLARRGVCVFALGYGTRTGPAPVNIFDMWGGNDIALSSRELASFVSAVVRRTGARQVDLVGHSQGALVARQYIAFDGGSSPIPGANRVHAMVSLSGTNHGTSFGGRQLAGAVAEGLGIPVRQLASATVGPSTVQQMTGSPFLARLNRDGETRPGISYLAVATRTDTVVTPARSAFLRAGPGATVRNVWLQDGCPSERANHAGVTSAARAQWLVTDFLDPQRTSGRAPCP
jgi:triacylglycerol esterase/lipase EstA (alpha/beta hydrolase family)